MTSAATAPLVMDPRRGMNRVITWSFAVHIVAAALFIFGPREWWSEPDEGRTVMVINIGGAEGPQTGGFTSVGARQVEQLAPEPKKPEPIPPSTSKPLPAAAEVQAPKPVPKPPDSNAPPDPIARPQAVGREITPGTSKVETGARGEGTGLAQGGAGGTAALEASIPDFCCQDYLTLMTMRIDQAWKSPSIDRGTVRLKFVILKDGTIRPPEVDTSSGIPLLDREARGAVMTVGKLPPLPPQHLPDTLTVYLTFVKKGPRF